MLTDPRWRVITVKVVGALSVLTNPQDAEPVLVAEAEANRVFDVVSAMPV